jgi:hypothetical protein
VYLSRFLCAGFALALAVTGCVGPRPLKGGKAVVTRTPGGSVQQTLIQSENPAQATKQEQESLKVRTYTVPAGSTWSAECGIRSAEWPVSDTEGGMRSAEGRKPEPVSARPQQSTLNSLPRRSGAKAGQPINLRQPSPFAPLSSSLAPRPSTLNSQPSTSFELSAPMPVVEREETRERTELGAAQKDMAREVGAKLASLKGIVWVGVGLFVFGLASLVYPPLKAVIGSVTTSAALMLGGVALMVLPTLVVGNELLILGVVALVVGAWFLAHRHRELKGKWQVASGQGSVISDQ